MEPGGVKRTSSEEIQVRVCVHSLYHLFAHPFIYRPSNKCSLGTYSVSHAALSAGDKVHDKRLVLRMKGLAGWKSCGRG